MKKIISYILLLVMCVSIFAGCAPAEDNALTQAKDYLYAMYKDAEVVTSNDYTVVSQVSYDGQVYAINWTTDKPENVQITAGENKMSIVKITAGTEDVNYKLIATLKNEAGEEVSVSFNHTIPAKAQVAGKTIVLAFPKDGKFVTGSHYLYTGKNKWQLNLTENEAEAIALEVIENADQTVTFKAGEYYLFCDATHVQFVKEQDDNTKFVLEAADTDGGYYIKCAVANYGGKAQYLEVYSGYLTCYGMGTDPSIYVFKMQESTTAAGTVSGQENNGTGDTGNNNTGNSGNNNSGNTGNNNSGNTGNSGNNNSGNTGSSSYTQVSELKDGNKIVIVNPASNMALSMNKVATYYNAGVDVSGGFGSITSAEIFTVKKNSDGSYSFTSLSGKVLALADEYSSLNDTGVNDKWELSSAGTKLFYLKNAARGNYLEWYASKSNWSTYAPETMSDEFVLAFYVTTGTGSSNSGSSNSGSSNSGSSNSGSSNSGSSNSGGTVTTNGESVTFDFSSLTVSDSAAIDATTAASLFNNAAVTSVEATKVYQGNPDTQYGAFCAGKGTGAGYIKLSNSSTNGQLALTFNKKVAKVEIVCHDWYTMSDTYPTNSNKVSVNGGEAQFAPYSTDATPGTLTFNLSEASQTVTIDTSNTTASKGGRVFIFKIVVYFAK